MNRDKMLHYCDLMLFGIERRLELIKDENVRRCYTEYYLEACTHLTEIEFSEEPNEQELVDLVDELYIRHTCMSKHCM